MVVQHWYDPKGNNHYFFPSLNWGQSGIPEIPGGKWRFMETSLITVCVRSERSPTPLPAVLAPPSPPITAFNISSTTGHCLHEITFVYLLLLRGREVHMEGGMIHPMVTFSSSPHAYSVLFVYHRLSHRFHPLSQSPPPSPPFMDR